MSLVCYFINRLAWLFITRYNIWRVGDAPTMMRLMESWSTYYQGLTPTWKPTFEKYLTPSPATAKTLPLEYVTTAVPYMGFLAVDHSLDYMIDGVENMTKSSKRIDLKFTSKTLYKLLEMVLRTSPEIDDASRKLSLTDLLSAYLVYVLQRVLDTKIVQVQQTFGVSSKFLFSFAIFAYWAPRSIEA